MQDMLNVFLNGANGGMGRIMNRLISEEKDMKVIAGISNTSRNLDDYPVYTSPGDIPADINEEVDVVIDFSHFSAVPGIVQWCASHNIPIVIGTTALDDACFRVINEAFKEIPVFLSANMSLGVNAILKAVAAITPALEENFNVEIIEKHHNRKLDSPSGTAVMLADKVQEVSRADKNYIYGRHSKHDEFNKDDIGIHAIRGGTIPGIHNVLYCGSDEMIELNHIAFSRDIFGNGAMTAARFIVRQKPGLYSMDDLLS